MIKDKFIFYAAEWIVAALGNEIPARFDSTRNNATSKNANQGIELSK